MSCCNIATFAKTASATPRMSERVRGRQTMSLSITNTSLLGSARALGSHPTRCQDIQGQFILDSQDNAHSQTDSIARICCFSPCLEQVLKTVATLRAEGFEGVSIA